MDIAYDLIYANEDMEDIGVLMDCTMDLAIGADENNFELTVDAANHVCHAGYYVYIEGDGVWRYSGYDLCQHCKKGDSL